MKLMQLSDREILNQIESPTMSMETLDIIGEAIHNSTSAEATLSRASGYAQRRCARAAADYVLNLEGNGRRHLRAQRRKDSHIRAEQGHPRQHRHRHEPSIRRHRLSRRHSNAVLLRFPSAFHRRQDRKTLLSLVEEVVTRRFYTEIGVERTNNRRTARYGRVP